jgi:putative oxygen-independent coproporphyrinogen III oxidase
MTDRPPFDAGFGVYVHWPFCASKCPYCDFNSHVRHFLIDENRYFEAFRREIEHQASLVPGREVGSIFFGGGTPSLMNPKITGKILDTIARYWIIRPDVEVTMEANPTSVEADKLSQFKSAGINRLSIGFQAMNDSDLRALGRLHSADEARAAVKTAASIFERYSFDLIYARPGQTPEAWANELKEAIALSAEHLSLYQLTIEPGTMFERMAAAGKLIPMPEDDARILFDTTREICDIAGLPAYEISNHARPGAECRHNLLYWRYGEYAGIGPGAHARLFTDGRRLAIANERHPETWLEAVEQQGHGIAEADELSKIDQANEFLLMGLRLTEGIVEARFDALAGQSVDKQKIAALIQDEFLTRSPQGRLFVTPRGVPVLNTLIRELSI